MASSRSEIKATFRRGPHTTPCPRVHLPDTSPLSLARAPAPCAPGGRACWPAQPLLLGGVLQMSSPSSGCTTNGVSTPSTKAAARGESNAACAASAAPARPRRGRGARRRELGRDIDVFDGRAHLHRALGELGEPPLDVLLLVGRGLERADDRLVQPRARARVVVVLERALALQRRARARAATSRAGATPWSRSCSARCSSASALCAPGGAASSARAFSRAQPSSALRARARAPARRPRRPWRARHARARRDARAARRARAARLEHGLAQRGEPRRDLIAQARREQLVGVVDVLAPHAQLERRRLGALVGARGEVLAFFAPRGREVRPRSRALNACADPSSCSTSRVSAISRSQSACSSHACAAARARRGRPRGARARRACARRRRPRAPASRRAPRGRRLSPRARRRGAALLGSRSRARDLLSELGVVLAQLRQQLAELLRVGVQVLARVARNCGARRARPARRRARAARRSSLARCASSGARDLAPRARRSGARRRARARRAVWSSPSRKRWYASKR